MRFNWPAFLFGMIVLLSTLTDVASAVECFPTQAAAMEAHPGASWYSYRGTGNHKRWYAGKKRLRCDPTERQVMRSEGRSDRSEVSAVATRPLPSMTGGAVTEARIPDLRYLGFDYRRPNEAPSLRANEYVRRNFVEVKRVSWAFALLETWR